MPQATWTYCSVGAWFHGAKRWTNEPPRAVVDVPPCAALADIVCPFANCRRSATCTKTSARSNWIQHCTSVSRHHKCLAQVEVLIDGRRGWWLQEVKRNGVTHWSVPEPAPSSTLSPQARVPKHRRRPRPRPPRPSPLPPPPAAQAAALGIGGPAKQVLLHSDDPLFPRSGDPFTLYRWIVDQYDQQLASLLASHHYHLTDTTRTPPLKHGKWMSRLGHSSREDIIAGRETLPDADVKFVTLVNEDDPRRHDEGYGYVIHRDSLLAQGLLPRYLFLHFDGHVVVAIVADDEREVGVFDSRPLPQAAAIMERYTHFFRNFFKKKRDGALLVPKVTSLNTTVDMQTEGCYNCFAWSRYIVYRHLIGGEEPAAIVNAMSTLAHTQAPAGAPHTCLVSEVFSYRTWAAQLADVMEPGTGALTREQVLAFSPAGQKSQQTARRQPRKRRRDGSGTSAGVPLNLVQDVVATRAEVNALRDEVQTLKHELQLTRKDAVTAARQAAVAQRQTDLMALELAAAKKQAAAAAAALTAELAAAEKEAAAAAAALTAELAAAKKEAAAAAAALTAANKRADDAIAAAAAAATAWATRLATAEAAATVAVQAASS